MKIKLSEFKNNYNNILKIIYSFSGSKQYKPYIASTISKTSNNKYSSFNINYDLSFLSDFFLLNYNDKIHSYTGLQSVNNYRNQEIVQSLALRKFKYKKENLISLPKQITLSISFDSLIKTRRSKREYTKNKLNMKELSTILYYTQGITGRAKINEEMFFLGGLNDLFKEEDYSLELRTYPSGGGLFPIELYFFAKNIDNLNDGIYKYVPEHHSIKLIKEITSDLNELASLYGIDVENVNLFMVYVYNKSFNIRKYGESGMIFALIELGSMSQNLHLACTALGCGSCDIGGFNKKKIEKIIDLNDIAEHVVSTTIIGR